MLGLPKSTVARIVQRFEYKEQIESAPRCGRPSLVTDREKAIIVRKIKKNPKMSAPKLTAEYCKETEKKVHPETIRRVLKREGYNGRTARKAPFINTRNKKRRLQFARDYLLKDETFWRDVVFCDESKFNIFGSDGKVTVWRKPNTEWCAGHVKSTVKHGGGSCMVWGCISAAGVGELVFIETTMTAIKYRDLLRENLKKSVAKMGLSSKWKFYQDNDPKHTSLVVREFLVYNCPHVIKTPAQSPDMNPIENLWEYLDRRVRETPPSSKTTLRARLQEEWAKIPTEYLQKIILNMPQRLQSVIDNHGNATRY